MNRVEFKALAEERLLDAQALFDAGRFNAAWYLSGYVVECALKACIAKLTKEGDFPDKRFADKAWTHRFGELAKAAGVDAAIDQLAKADKEFRSNWEFVNVWSEENRYDSYFDDGVAKLMLDAITDPDHGVLQCIKRYW